MEIDSAKNLIQSLRTDSDIILRRWINRALILSICDVYKKI